MNTIPGSNGPLAPLTTSQSAKKLEDQEITNMAANLKTLKQSSTATTDQIVNASKELTEAIENRVGCYQFNAFTYIAKQMSEGIDGIREGIIEAKRTIKTQIEFATEKDHSQAARNLALGAGTVAYGLGVSLFALTGVAHFAARIISSAVLYPVAGAIGLVVVVLGTLPALAMGKFETFSKCVKDASMYGAGRSVERLLQTTSLLRTPITALTSLGIGLQYFGEKGNITPGKLTAPINWIKTYLYESLRQEGTEIKTTKQVLKEREKRAETHQEAPPSSIVHDDTQSTSNDNQV